MPVRVGALVALFLAMGFDTVVLGHAVAGERFAQRVLEVDHRDEVFQRGGGSNQARVPRVGQYNRRRPTPLSKVLAESAARAKLLDPLFQAIFSLSPHIEAKVYNGLVCNSVGLLRRVQQGSPSRLRVPTWHDVDIELSVPPEIGHKGIRDTLLERARREGLKAIARREKHHPTAPNGSNGGEAEQHLQVLLPCAGSCVQLDMSIYPSAEAMNSVKAWLDWRYLKLVIDRGEAFHRQIGRLPRVDSVQTARELVPNLEHPEYVQAVLGGLPHVTHQGIPKARHGEAPLLLLYLLGKPEYSDIPLDHGLKELKRVGILGPGQTAMLHQFFGPQLMREDGMPVAAVDDPKRHRLTAYWLSSFRVRGASVPRRMDRVVDAAGGWRLAHMFPGLGQVADDQRAWERTKQAVLTMYKEAYGRWQDIVRDIPCGVAQCSDGRDWVFGGMFSGLKTPSALWEALQPIAGGLPLHMGEPVFGYYSSLEGIEKGWAAARKLY